VARPAGVHTELWLMAGSKCLLFHHALFLDAALDRRCLDHPEHGLAVRQGRASSLGRHVWYRVRPSPAERPRRVQMLMKGLAAGASHLPSWDLGFRFQGCFRHC